MTGGVVGSYDPAPQNEPVSVCREAVWLVQQKVTGRELALAALLQLH